MPLWRDRLAWALLAVAIILAGGFFTLTWRTGDDARYIGLARSLLDGAGYVQQYLPHHPVETITPPAQPVMIALSMWLFGRGILPGQIFSVAMYILGALFVYAWARERLRDRWMAACVTVIGQFAFSLVAMSSWYMVEAHFVAASFLALFVADRAVATRRVGMVLLLGIICGYVYLIRATGLAFAAAGGCYFLFRREWKQLALFCAGFLLLSVPWMIRTYWVTGATEAYIHFESNLAGAAGGYPWMRIPRDIATAFPVYFIQALPDALFYRLMGEFGLLRHLGLSGCDSIARWLILALVTLGFLLRIRRPGFTELYWIFFWLIITAPPFPPQGHWYVYPLLPIAAMYLAESVRWLAMRINRPRWPGTRVARAVVSLLALYSLATASWGAAVHASKEWQRRGLAPWAPERYATYNNEYMDAWGRMVESGLWIASNLPPDTLVVSRQPAHIYLIVGLEGWRYDLPEVEGTNLFDRMDRAAMHHPVALIEDSFAAYAGASFSYGVGHWALRELFERHADRLKLIYECGPPTTRVWSFERTDAEQEKNDENRK